MATLKVLGHSIKVPEADNHYFHSFLHRTPVKTIPKGSMRTVLMELISEPPGFFMVTRRVHVSFLSLQLPHYSHLAQLLAYCTFYIS